MNTRIFCIRKSYEIVSTLFIILLKNYIIFKHFLREITLFYRLQFILYQRHLSVKVVFCYKKNKFYLTALDNYSVIVVCTIYIHFKSIVQK